MEMSAAVFRKVHEPLTIEQVEIDKPWGREVLVRTVATGVCHSDLHVVDGTGPLPARSPVRARPRRRRRRRGGGRRCHHGAGRRSRGRLPVRLLRHLPAMPERPSECLHRRHRRARRDGDAARVAERPAVPHVRRHRQLRRAHAAAREFAGADRSGDSAGSRGAGRMRRADRRRRGAAQRGHAGRTDGGGVRLRRRRAVDRAGRAHRRRAADHRGGPCSIPSWRWRRASARRIR